MLERKIKRLAELHHQAVLPTGPLLAAQSPLPENTFHRQRETEPRPAMRCRTEEEVSTFEMSGISLFLVLYKTVVKLSQKKQYILIRTYRIHILAYKPSFFWLVFY